MAQDLMSKIDSVKQKLTDSEYKGICDDLMSLHNEKKDIRRYKITFTIISNFIEQHGNQLIGISPKMSRCAMTGFYDVELYKRIKKDIEEDGMSQCIAMTVDSDSKVRFLLCEDLNDPDFVGVTVESKQIHYITSMEEVK